MSAIYASPLNDTLTFKGGASQSKAYQLTDRFSNYIDLTNTSANWCWTCCAMAISFWRDQVRRKRSPEQCPAVSWRLEAYSVFHAHEVAVEILMRTDHQQLDGLWV
ncbi:MAG: nucleotidyl transferase AbiEii/AbiGii toxin family protein [Methylocystis sp.]